MLDVVSEALTKLPAKHAYKTLKAIEAMLLMGRIF